MPATTEKPAIQSLDLTEIEAVLAERGQPKYRAQQVLRWLYEKRVTSFSEMTDLPAALRAEGSRQAIRENLANLPAFHASPGMGVPRPTRFDLAGWTGKKWANGRTLKVSFLDGDEIPCKYDGMKHVFSGKRLKRGLYKSKDGFLINADVNGGYNIGRKAFPNAFVADGIEGVGLHPKIIVVS
jgi:hypothetical protein